MENIDYSSLSVRQLHVFLCVLDSGSVGKAADQLDLNQSTISYSLEKLRAVFGDPLFVKSGRGIVATDRARAIAPRIREILFELQVLTSSSEYRSGGDTSPLAIAVNVMAMLPYCRALYSKIHQEAPQAPVKIVELGSRKNILGLLESQTVDAVISYRPRALQKVLNFSPLLSFEQVCYYDGEQRGPIKTLQNYCDAEHAVLDFGGKARSVVDDRLEVLSLKRNTKLHVPNIAALGGLIKGTRLITTMQYDLSRHIFSDLDYCQPPLKLPQIDFDLIWHRRSQNNERMIWLRELIKETITGFRYGWPAQSTNNQR